MSSVNYGFIGAGNMGGALAHAVASSVGSNQVVIADISTVKAQNLAEEIKCSFSDTAAVAKEAKYIFLGVKPQVLNKVLDSIKEILEKREDRFILVSMAAGVSISQIEEMLQTKYPIIRIMPNTPVSKGKGMILYTANASVFMDELGEFCNALKLGGRLDKIDEKLIDAASAVSGCGPAFVYMFAEAMADGAVECGLPRNKALEYAAQTLSGAAELLLTTGKHPGVLKDEVCSPGGTTIAGVHALEENGFRGAVINAVKSAYNKTINLGK